MLLVATPLWACSRSRRPPCGEFQEHGPRFVGDVVSEQLIKPTLRRFELHVVESFSEEVKVGTVAAVVSGTGGADCSYRLAVGRRYFIDSYKDGNSNWIGLCSYTGPESIREVEVRELRMKASGTRLPDLTGSVEQYLPEVSDPVKYPVVEGVVVKLRPLGVGKTIASKTDELGVYRFDDLLSGTYEISIGLPRGLRLLYSSLPLQSMLLTVPKAVGTSSACHVWLDVADAGIMEGRIVFGSGRKTDGVISVYKANSDATPGQLVSARFIEDDGTFYVPYLPPGRYRISYKGHNKRERFSDQVVTLAEAERKQHLSIMLR